MHAHAHFNKWYTMRMVSFEFKENILHNENSSVTFSMNSQCIVNFLSYLFNNSMFLFIVRSTRHNISNN